MRICKVCDKMLKDLDQFHFVHKKCISNTVNLNGDEIARIIEMSFDYGWEAGRDSEGDPFDGSIANAKYQINNWLEENGKI